ncbi:MAG TPA: methyltransferase domain-containing protein [Anaerolineae bacterium]|nr:methyltransferase domain-containing protein [Anaerolineae bacterium]
MAVSADPSRGMYDADYFQAQINKSDDKVAFQYGRLLEFIGPLAPDPRILDAGCGAGPALRYLHQRGLIPFGSDLVEYPLMQAHQLVPAARLVQCNSDQALPFADNSFDVILMSEVIEHVISPEFTLRECWRILRNNGTVALTTPNLWDIRRAYYPALGKVWSGDADATHHILFNPRTLRAVLIQAGFAKVRVRAGFKPIGWISSRKLKLRTALPGLVWIGNTLIGAGIKQ